MKAIYYNSEIIFLNNDGSRSCDRAWINELIRNTWIELHPAMSNAEIVESQKNKDMQIILFNRTKIVLAIPDFYIKLDKIKSAEALQSFKVDFVQKLTKAFENVVKWEIAL